MTTELQRIQKPIRFSSGLTMSALLSACAAFLLEFIMKPCKKCKKNLPLSEYSRDKRLSDGHRNDCKNCLKEIRNRPDRKQKEREWQRRNMGRYAETRKNYRNSHKSEEAIRMNKYRKNNRYKINTHQRVYVAIRDGKLVKPSKCSECGQHGLVQGHHEDYSKPLEVVWLCPKCHKSRHLIGKEAV